MVAPLNIAAKFRKVSYPCYDCTHISKETNSKQIL